MMDSTNTLRVGLAVGHGAGPEVAAVFEDAMQQLAARRSLGVELVRSNRVYNSYSSLPATENDKRSELEIFNETMDDATHYQKFCEEEVAKGLRVIFQTSMGAQSLYAVAQRLEAVRVSHFERGTASFLIIRDQAQGFYSGQNQVQEDQVVVSSISQFSNSIFKDIISFAIQRAREAWGDLKCLNLVYKFHLPDNIFPSWASKWSMEFGLKIRFVPPDVMNNKLMASEAQGRHVVIASNEDADIMENTLRSMSEIGVQEATHAENIYLHPSMNRLSEYQAEQGSAHLTGEGIANPSATIRAAAAILEQHGNCTGIQAEVDNALQIIEQQNRVTPEQGGNITTSAFVNTFFQTLSSPDYTSPIGNDGSRSPTFSIKNDDAYMQAPDPSLPFMGKSTAIMVIDFQNDIISHEPLASRKIMADKVKQVIGFSRAQGQEVIFSRYMGDLHHQGPSLRHRNITQKQKSLCIEGSWGAELSPEIVPIEGERVFDKKGYFDAFLNTEFAKYIGGRQFEHLILMGLHADIAVDATARTAFQKGLWVTVLQDCTQSLYLPGEEMFTYMQKVYGARVVRSKDLLEM